MSDDVHRLPSHGIYIPQFIRFSRCCTSVLDFHTKNVQVKLKLLAHGYRYHTLRKTFGKFFRSYSYLLSKFGDISFQEYVTTGIYHQVFYGISLGSKIVKRLRRRQYDPLIIERTIGDMVDLLHRPSLKHCACTLTYYCLTMQCGLYDEPCPNLHRGDKVLIFVPFDC